MSPLLQKVFTHLFHVALLVSGAATIFWKFQAYDGDASARLYFSWISISILAVSWLALHFFTSVYLTSLKKCVAALLLVFALIAALGKISFLSALLVSLIQTGQTIRLRENSFSSILISISEYAGNAFALLPEATIIFVSWNWLAYWGQFQDPCTFLQRVTQRRK